MAEIRVTKPMRARVAMARSLMADTLLRLEHAGAGRIVGGVVYERRLTSTLRRLRARVERAQAG